jgi:peroxiredoxin
MEINQPVPDFELPDLSGMRHHLSDYRGKIVIVNFWSCECPHSERTDKAILSMFGQWGDDVILLPIASNRNENTVAIKTVADLRRLPRVLIDAQCTIADLYEAQTTPHVFVIDRAGSLRYRGAVDDMTFRRPNPTRFFLEQAAGSLLNGNLPEVAETPAYGCTIVREV